MRGVARLGSRTGGRAGGVGLSGGDVWFADGIGVAAGVVDAEAEQVAQPPRVAAGGDGFLQDAVLAQGLDAAGDVESEEHPAACDDRGSLTVYFLVMVLSLLLIAGLVFDGGRLLAARREVQDAAQDAARAGAQAIDVTAVRDGTTTLDQADAAAAARTWLSSEGEVGTVTVDADAVSVSVSRTVPLALLAAAGIPSRTVRAEESARIVDGVTGAES